jgi:hypothetical protein
MLTSPQPAIPPRIPLGLGLYCSIFEERDGVGCGSRKGIVGNKVEKVESWGGGSVSDVC